MQRLRANNEGMMMKKTDHELLELAAKAGGLRIKYWAADNYPVVLDRDQREYGWNPLVYDSDALRLMVELQIQAGTNAASREPTVFAWARDRGGVAQYEAAGSDAGAATRRAITRAAAEVGARVALASA